MLMVKELSKRFGMKQAIADLSLTLEEGHIFGLLGTNGAGKSTLLRVMGGILRADTGSVCLDEASVYENPAAKRKICYLSDEPTFLSGASLAEMGRMQAAYYPEYSESKLRALCERFALPMHERITSFSKGTQKRAQICLGLALNPRVLLCDETFDGLDPVMRQGIKSLFAKEMDERGLTPVIASHNLRELEDICDHIGLLHKGGVLLSKDLEELKCNLQKIQCVLPEGNDNELRRQLDILQFGRRGKLITMTVRGDSEEIIQKIEAFHPVYCEALPLSLEEIFISETEVVGYDIKNLIL